MTTYPRDAPAASPEQPSATHHPIVVTGATRGIGLALAHELARLGGTIVMMAREPARGAAAVDEVRRASGNDDIALIACDLASLDALRAAAAEITTRWPIVRGLVNNAGVSVARRRTTADGHEMTLAVNHLAPFLLTHLLLPAMRAAPSARIVTLSSELERWGRIDFDDLEAARRYDGTRAYLQSKLANMLFTYGLAERLRGTSVTANCVYPGLVATDLLRDRWWWSASWLRPLWRRIFRTPQAGAETAVWLAVSDAVEGVSGSCFKDRRQVRSSRRSRDAAARERLWRVSAEMTGVG